MAGGGQGGGAKPAQAPGQGMMGGAPQGAPQAPQGPISMNIPPPQQGGMPQQLNPQTLQMLQGSGIDINKLVQDYQQQLAMRQGGGQGMGQGPVTPPAISSVFPPAPAPVTPPAISSVFPPAPAPAPTTPPMGMPQVQGNPNATPIQGRDRMMRRFGPMPNRNPMAGRFGQTQ